MQFPFDFDGISLSPLRETFRLVPQRLDSFRMTDVGGRQSIIVRATEVVPAMHADQLAVVAGEQMAAVGADLAMVIDRKSFSAQIVAGSAERTTL